MFHSRRTSLLQVKLYQDFLQPGSGYSDDDSSDIIIHIPQDFAV
jgi:hypothetical protein